MELLVNATVRTVAAAGDKPLLWVLREDLGLTGTKYGCGIGRCGACMVHVEGVATPSCVLPLFAVEGLAITTIEGIGTADRPHPVQQAWLDAGVSQCGYCQTGMVMSAVSLLAGDREGDPQAIAERLAVLCRCGSYPRIAQALDLLAVR
ncbi:MAG: (2Fe-2S)-binding protein [Sneathiellaceae bacterium]